jgi:hypothetical protein
MRIRLGQLRQIVKEECNRAASHGRQRSITESSSFQVDQKLTHQQVQQAFPDAWNEINSKLENDGTSLEQAQGIFVIEPLDRLEGTHDVGSEPNAEVVPGGVLCYYDDNFALGWLGPKTGQYEGGWDSID